LFAIDAATQRNFPRLRRKISAGCFADQRLQARIAADCNMAFAWRTHMAEKVYKKIEIVGTSSTSFSDAANAAVEKASQTIRNLDWFEVTETRGHIKDGKIDQYQVTMKIGFRLD
jgi:flavin-binding protein dodecin